MVTPWTRFPARFSSRSPARLPPSVPQRLLAAISFLAAGVAASAACLAALVWLRYRPEDRYWSRLPAYWLSSAAWAYWTSLAGLHLAALWLAPRRGRDGLDWLPATAFLAGLGYAGWQFVRQALRGTPLLGQVAAFWPDAVLLGLALTAGAWVGRALLRHSPGAGAGKPPRPGEPREPRSVARGRIRGGRSGNHGHGPRS